jgi:uncharacterized protein (DUF488 family)
MSKAKKIFTIGYGGRSPADFVALLQRHGVRRIADVRILPQRAMMGAYVKAKSPEKGIERLLADAGIAYSWFEELGNEFRTESDAMERYRAIFAREAEDRCRRLVAVARKEPVCLLCAEKDPAGCHRSIIATHLASEGFEIVDIV